MQDYTKIISKGVVYIPVSNIRQRLGIAIEPLHHIMGVPCLTEAEYNDLITSDRELWLKNKCHKEITRTSSLTVNVEDRARLIPLQQAFFPDLDVNAEYAKIIREEEQKIELTEFSSKYYRESVKFLSTPELFDINKLHEVGLDVQCFTEINEKGSIGLSVFIVGKGIFYTLYIDETYPEDWTGVRFEDGAYVVCETDDFETKELRIVPNGDRDFRQYNVFENLKWCLQNCSLNNEWQDELNCCDGGISFNVNLTLLAKLFNKKSFPDNHFIEGIINI